MSSGRSGTGAYTYRKNRAILLAQNDVCWLCGHPGAQTADHVVVDRDWPRHEVTGKRLPGFDALDNLRPAHGTMGNAAPPNRCLTCGRLCNQSRGDRAPGYVTVLRPQSREW